MNDEMAMKRRGGTKSKIVVERMLNVFDLHFPTPAVEAMSRIYACLIRVSCVVLTPILSSVTHVNLIWICVSCELLGVYLVSHFCVALAVFDVC